MSPTQDRYRWKDRSDWRRYGRKFATLMVVLVSLGLSSCHSAGQSQAAGGGSSGQGQGRGASGGQRGERGGDQLDPAPVVEILQVTSGGFDDSEIYTGSTEPRQQIENWMLFQTKPSWCK